MLEPPKESLQPLVERLPDPIAVNDERSKRQVRKRKSNHLILKLITGWILFMLLIVGVAKFFFGEAAPPVVPPQSTAAVTASQDAAENAELLNSGGQKCVESFMGYLAAETPEGRNQFVLSPVDTASKMSRFYSMNPFTKVDQTALSLSSSSVLRFAAGSAIETHWTSREGNAYDAVFREENGEWRLDWDHFARYSEYPWSLFLSGSGPSEGEFRLLARERLAEERKNENTISIVLYAPRFGMPHETGFQSPEFLVSRSSRSGQILDAAFKLARSGKMLMFSSNVAEVNPEGMIRVRVKVKRIEDELNRKYEISEVKACHWYSVDEPGVPIAQSLEQAAPKAPSK